MCYRRVAVRVVRVIGRLLDRRTERKVMDRLVDDVRAGRSESLVVRGEAGIGKTALLEYVLGRANGCQVAPAAGVQAEQELAFAAPDPPRQTLPDRQIDVCLRNACQPGRDAVTEQLPQLLPHPLHRNRSQAMPTLPRATRQGIPPDT